MHGRRFSPLILTVLMAFLGGCSSSEKLDTTTAEGAFRLAQKYQKNERFEEAISYYREVKNKHPYSRYATDSELAIADIEFQRESYAEAEAGYRLFKELHPNHEKSDYVTYRLGLSIYNQLPSTVDRDLSEASQAILYFDEVITSYPESKFLKDAKQKRQEAKVKLAEKQMYIADFYYRTGKWLSALGRYEDVINEHPDLGFDARALLGAARSAQKVKELDKVRKYVSVLKQKFPKTSESQDAQQELVK
jgi:outer membrane protein assembly factor BamD